MPYFIQADTESTHNYILLLIHLSVPIPNTHSIDARTQTLLNIRITVCILHLAKVLQHLPSISSSIYIVKPANNIHY